MLFTTALFVLVFLPLVLAGFFVFGRFNRGLAAAWLFLASLFFYGYWMPEYTLLLLASIAVNFRVGIGIARAHRAERGARGWLVAGLVFNLGLLAYFKYANFFIDNLNVAMGLNWQVVEVVLPIGISFYTFTQIAFLVDSYRRKVSEFNPVHYGLFVTYFPHLIAGPVLHHAQMMPQFAQAQTYAWNGGHVAAGLAIFALGLFKKVVLADGLSPYADAVFRPVDGGVWPSMQEAWLAAVAYTLQLYFDFSGYSDMAIGLSWMFNVRLPFNFDSPYKATSITEFWRRWHISLSNFLRDYLYIALGGNRKGEARRYANLMITMLLGGLWHGASWSFVIWGGLHGLYLMANHAFRALCAPAWLSAFDRSRAAAVAAWALTMLCVVVAWVFFRAETLPGALRIIGALAGAPQAEGTNVLLWNAGLQWSVGLGWCLLLGAVVALAPNSNLLGQRCLAWVAVRGERAVFCGVLASCAIGTLVLVNTARDAVSAFIYFNF